MPPEPGKKSWFEKLRCFLGFHDDEIIEVSFQFADGGCIEKLRCKRCGRVIVRTAK